MVLTELELLDEFGKEFHILGPATENALSPNFLVVRGIYKTTVSTRIDMEITGVSCQMKRLYLLNSYLHGVAVHDAHLPDDNSTRPFLALLNFELTDVVRELKWRDNRIRGSKGHVLVNSQ